MICDDFQFNGKWLSGFDMGTFDTEDSQSFPTRSIDKSEITSMKQTPNFYGVRYDDVLELHFLLIKDSDYITSKHRKLDSIEINRIKKWLELNKYSKLVCRNNAVIDSENINVNYYGIFTSVQPYIINEQCYGIEATFTCNAPYGFSDDYIVDYRINSSSTVNGIFENKSSEDNYLYPLIEITVVGSSVFYIINKTDNNNKMQINIPSGISKLYIDCENKQIYDNKNKFYTFEEIGITIPSSSYYNFVSADTYIFYWLRLLQGNNNLSFKSNNSNVTKVRIKTNYPIKVGGV